MSKKTSKILILFVFIIIIVIALFLLVSKLGSKNTGENNPIPKKKTKVDCKMCHNKLNTEKLTGAHNNLTCQDCHGIGEKHISNPLGNNMPKPMRREDCGECHSFDGAKKDKTTKHIDLTKHNKDLCIRCHNPHSTGLIIGDSELKSGDPSVCKMCHTKILNILNKGMHKSLACQACHGNGAEHLKAPGKGTILKPSERSFCGKCHSGKKGNVKQIDINEHNIELKCVECHIAHNPLEFK